MNMKILILWRGLPHSSHPSYARPFYFINHYGSTNSITLISPYHGKISAMLMEFEGVDEPIIESSFLKKAIFSFLRRLTWSNLRYAKDFNVSRLYHPSLQRKVNGILERSRFDIIYSDHWAYSYLYYLKIRNRINTPVVLEFFSPTLFTQRSFLRYGSSREKIKSFLSYLCFRFFEVGRYKLFDAGIYVSKTHLELSKPFLPKQCYIIPPGVDLNYFKPLEMPSETPIIVFCGTMRYPPNILGVIHFYYKVYPYIKKEIPDIKFYVVGRNPDRRIKKLSLDPSVIVTGAVDDVRPYYSKADVFVNPITVDDGGIKNKVLEAMAMGKAVVSTPLGVRDIGVTDNENVVVAKNDREFAEKVIELLRDEKERKRIGKNARKFVEENYSWEKQSRALYNVFRELVNGS